MWKSDGTAAGTVMVKDISPSHLTDVNGTLFFSGFDGYSEEGGSGLELWKSDGTDSGTVIVSDINPGDHDSSSPGWLTNVNGALFFTADDDIHGRELWALGERLPIFIPLVTK